MVSRRRWWPHPHPYRWSHRVPRTVWHARALGAVRRRPAAALAVLLLAAATGCDSADGNRAPAHVSAGPERWRIDYVTDSRDATLFDIAAAGRDDGWAIGQESDDYVLLHRHDGRWRPARMPLPASDGALVNVALDASAPDNVWLFAAVGGLDGTDGDPERPAARRWDGHRWRTVPVDFSARDVAVLAPDDVWALDSATDDRGRPVTRHWDGRRWRTHVLPYPAEALSASGPHDVWAVGRRDDPTGRTGGQPAAMHFGGTAWRSVPVPADRFARHEPNEQSELTEVVAVSRDDAWAFGAHSSYRDGAASDDRSVSTAWHWDGRRWRKVPHAPDPHVGIHPFPAMVAAGDGAGGFVLGGHQHGTAAGRIRVIDDPSLPTDPSDPSDPPEQPEPSDQATASHPHPPFELNDLQRVPGTREVWAAGFIGATDQSGGVRGAIARCTLNG